jgi:hypothetical protein
MTEDEFVRLLDEQAIAVVHFSHFADMRKGLVFPGDMLAAIANKDAWALSCCALTPGRRMQLPGDVGILLRPKLVNVLSVSSGDAGASTLPDGSELSGGDPPTREAVLASLDPGFQAYNEWRVRGAEVVGIFVANPGLVLAKKRHDFDGPLGPESAIGSEPISLTTVFDAFPGLPLYAMGADRIAELPRPASGKATPSASDH